MYEWLLIIILHFPVGQAREPLALGGERTYLSLDHCTEEGGRFANWLSQEFVLVEWRCDPVPKQS